jgi:hypothetical protein
VERRGASGIYGVKGALPKLLQTLEPNHVIALNTPYSAVEPRMGEALNERCLNRQKRNPHTGDDSGFLR